MSDHLLSHTIAVALGRTTSRDGEPLSDMKSGTRYTVAIGALIVGILVVGVALAVVLVGGDEAVQSFGLDSSRMGWIGDVVNRLQPKTCSVMVIVSPPGAGSVSSDSENLSGECGQELLLSALAREGYVFDHWEGDATSSLPLVSVKLDSDKVVTAVFRPAAVDWDPGDLSSLPRYDDGVQIWYRVWFTEMIGEHVAGEGRVFAVVDLAIQNSDFSSFRTHPLGFSVTLDGVRYPPAWYVLPDGLQSRDLRNRERLAGRLVFELPHAVRDGGFTLMYENASDHVIDWILVTES